MFFLPAASSTIAVDSGLFILFMNSFAIWLGKKLAKELENKDKKIVVILPDSGERYLSINLFEN